MTSTGYAIMAYGSVGAIIAAYLWLLWRASRRITDSQRRR
ncbi:MAG: hypothetical protein GIKADHBN_03542 [Phycisphaerales bacterium]|nr:hypothetical protein [Phycisphaerales bacterium]